MRWITLALVTAMSMNGPAGAVELIKRADLTDAGRWRPVDGAPAAEVSKSESGAAVIKLPCPFSKLEGWRFGWDLMQEMELKEHRWLKLRVRADDPDAVANVILYLEAGSGWYTASLGGPKREWSELVGTRVKFGTEGVPGGWNAVKRMRIGILPAADRDTAVYISGMEGTSALALEDAGRVGPYESLTDLKIALPGTTMMKEAIGSSEALLARAMKYDDVSAAEPQKLIVEAREKLIDAYVRSQEPKSGELRAGWCHSGTGPGMGWTKAIETMADNGFNAIFPNLLWSGVAYYRSKVLPVAPEVAAKGDQLEEIIAVARRRGVAVHVWKVCWQFGSTDPGVAVPFRFAGRMQVDRDGKQGEWLCPSNPLNRRYELDAIRELVKNYDIDGFQLDYIRFAGTEWCFCSSCRKAFQKEVMRKFKDWPAPVVEGGKYEGAYLDFRRDTITSFVREVRSAIKKIKPEVALSAAVFPVSDRARGSVLQDWGRWVDEGLLDFVCPMNYTENLGEMRSRTRADIDAVAGKIPVYEGLFAAFSPDQKQSPDMAVAQIVAAREIGASGFVLFEIQDHMLRDLLPALRLGVTADVPSSFGR